MIHGRGQWCNGGRTRVAWYREELEGWADDVRWVKTEGDAISRMVDVFICVDGANGACRGHAIAMCMFDASGER